MLSFPNGGHLLEPKLLCKSLLVGLGNVCTRGGCAMRTSVNPGASRTGLSGLAVSSALCMSRQMTASISQFSAYLGKFRTPSISVTLGSSHQSYAGQRQYANLDLSLC